MVERATVYLRVLPFLALIIAASGRAIIADAVVVVLIALVLLLLPFLLLSVMIRRVLIRRAVMLNSTVGVCQLQNATRREGPP